MIAVEVVFIGAVVNPMVGGGHEDVFKPPESADGLGVNPVLVKEVKETDGEKTEGVKVEEHERHKEHKRGEGGGPGLPEGGGEVVVDAGVMIDVTGPENAKLVVSSMVPVVGEVLENHEEDLAPGCDGNFNEAELIDPIKERDERQLPELPDGEKANPHAEAGHRVFDGVPEGVAPGGVRTPVDPPVFKGHRQQKDGDRDQEHYLVVHERTPVSVSDGVSK